MHVQIRLKPPKKLKPTKRLLPHVAELLPARNQPAPSYDEALMMPEHVSAPPQSVLARVEDRQGGVDEDDDSYSADCETFESYSVEDNEDVEHQVDLEGGIEGGQGESESASGDDDGGEGDELEGDDGDGDGDGDTKSDGTETARRQIRSSKPHALKTRQRGAVSYTYDEGTFAMVTRLRAQNKRLVSQVEQQCKLIESLAEDKKQLQRVIQVLRADVNMHKQTIHALQSTNTRGTRLSIGQRDQISHERPATTASAFPSASAALPRVLNDAGSRPASPRSLASRWASSPSPPSPSTTVTASSLRPLSPPCSPPPQSPGGRGRSRVGEVKHTDKPASQSTLTAISEPSCPHRRHEKDNSTEKNTSRLERVEHERKEQAARHAHQLANYSHELSRLERQLELAQRAAQEKDNALRLQRTRQLYHSPNNTAAGAGSTNSGCSQAMAPSKRRNSLHGRNSIFSDDIWRDLLPSPPSRTSNGDIKSLETSSAGMTDVTALGFSSHVGLAFEKLVGHPLVALHDVSLDASAREWLFELRACGSQMLELHAAFQTLGRSLKVLAESRSTYQLADALTHESRVLLQAEQALVFVADKAEQEFWCRVPRTASSSSNTPPQMVTVRSKLLPFGSPVTSHSVDDSGKPSWATPCGLASMVFHSKRSLLLAAGQTSKHACFSPNANDSTDRLVDHPSASTLLVPVIHDGHVLAVVQVVGKTTRVEALGLSIALEKRDSFLGEDQALLSLLCHFASGLLPKVAYFTEVESNKVNEETLIQLAPEIFTCLRFDELGKIVIENAKDILDADRCSLFVADNAERMLFNWQSDISGAGVEVLDASRKATMSIPFGHGIVGLVAETWQPINIADAYDDPRFNSTWDKKTNYRTKSMLTVPILSNAIKKQPVKRGGPDDKGSAAPPGHGDHKPPSQTPVPQKQHTEQTLLGVVQVINKSGGAPFRSKDEFLLQTITKLIALAIENSQLFQKNQALCWDVGRLIADGDLVEALTSLGASAEEIIGVESACIYVVDEANNELVTFHRKRKYRIALRPDDYRNSLMEDALHSQQVLIVNDVATAPHFNAYVDSIGGIPARNVLFAPLLIDDPDAVSVSIPLASPTSTDTSPLTGKRLVGLMQLVNTKGRKLQFDRHDLFLSIVHSQSCSVVASIIEKQEMLREKAQVARLLDTSMSFFKEMSPVGIINAVYNSCTAIFSVEKAHLFLWEPDKRHMWTSKLAPNTSVMTGAVLDAHRASNGLEGDPSGQHRRNSKQTPNFIPTLSTQTRRISVLTDQRLRAPTTEGLLERVLVHGTAIIVREWIEPPATSDDDDDEDDDERSAGQSADNRPATDGAGSETPAAPAAPAAPARPVGRHVMQAAASDVRLGFTKHSVLACPVWDHYGLEVVGVLVMLFRKGHAVQHSEELANLPILSRQIAGALNVCGDLSLVSARCRQLQSMLELSRRKAEGAVSLTLSSRGNLVSFSQPVNVSTAAFNVFELKAAVHGTQALNMGVHALPMDDEGHRWGFQLSGASVQLMLSEHCVQWVGKDLGGGANVGFDKLVTDLQGVYQRKEALKGAVDCRAAASMDDVDAGWVSLSLPKDVVVQLRQLLWRFTDAEWRVDVARAASSLFADARAVSRLQLEQALREHAQLDQMQWDLLHARFADAASDLVDVAAMLRSLRPRVRAFRAFLYELVPVLDPVTQAVVGVHVLLLEAVDGARA